MPRHFSTVQSFKASDGKLFSTVDDLTKYEFLLVLQQHWMDADLALAHSIFQGFEGLHDIWHARERYLNSLKNHIDTTVIPPLKPESYDPDVDNNGPHF